MSDVEFVAVGYDVNNNPSNTIKYSSDGKTWTSVTSNGFPSAGYGVISKSGSVVFCPS